MLVFILTCYIYILCLLYNRNSLNFQLITAFSLTPKSHITSEIASTFIGFYY